MNSFWNKNISLFKTRFCFLSEQLEKTFPLNEQKEPDFDFWFTINVEQGKPVFRAMQEKALKIVKIKNLQKLLVEFLYSIY